MLAENYAEVSQMLRDAFEDAILMGVDEAAMRQILADIAGLRSPKRPSRGQMTAGIFDCVAAAGTAAVAATASGAFAAVDRQPAATVRRMPAGARQYSRCHRSHGAQGQAGHGAAGPAREQPVRPGAAMDQRAL